MKRINQPLVGAFLLLALTLSTLMVQTVPAAQREQKTRKSEMGGSSTTKRTNFSGAVVAIDANRITVKSTKGEKSAVITSKTKVTGEPGQTLTLASIPTGARVRVYASSDGNGEWTATTIKLMPAKTGKTKKESSATE